MKNILVSIITMIFMVLACGPYRPSVEKSPLQEKEKVILLDYSLTHYLNVVKHAASNLPDGQLEVKLAMQNEENNDVWTDIQVVFRGEDGFELEKTNWEPFLFNGHTVTTFTKNSLSSQAKDYRILIRKTK